MWELLVFVFFLAFLVSFFLLIAGLVNPRWVKMSRRKSSWVFGLCLAISFILMGIAGSKVDPPAVEVSEPVIESPTESPTESPSPPESPSPTEPTPLASPEQPETTTPTPEILAEASQVYEEMTTLLSEGRAMEALRNTDDLQKLKACGDQMRSRQARVDELSEQIEGWGLSQTNPVRLFLSAATTGLRICVNCTPSASQMCDLTEIELNDAKNAIAEAGGELLDSPPLPSPKTESTPSPSTYREQPNLPDCVNGDCNCGDFSTRADAQRVLEAFPGDPHQLDRDNDGIACESLN